MKNLALLFFLLSACMVRAEGTNSTPAQASQSVASELPRSVIVTPIFPLEAKPNEVTLGKVQASGILVEAVRTRRPLKLVNPLSPPANSSPEDNVLRNVVTGKVSGLKLFAIRF